MPNQPVPPVARPWTPWFHWAERHPLLTIGLVLLVLLGPWLDKAVHIDDTLFIWTAEQIQHHPRDFFGFQANWYGESLPMAEDNCNPPAISYAFAVVINALGWQELYLHGLILLLAFAAAAGMFQLARRWCDQPLLAVLIAVTTPVFLVSATTLMCDMPMLALWLWCLVFWEWGLADQHRGYFLVAALLAGLAVLTKYSALTLLPLLPILGWLRRGRPGLWLLWLLVPLGFIEGYQIETARLYGTGLITAASNYASQTRFLITGGWVNKMVIGLAYAGGCWLLVLGFVPWLVPRRVWLVGGPLVLLALAGLLANLGVAGNFGAGLVFQMALMLLAGFWVLVLAALELWQRRDAETLLLALWLGSGLLFATVLNWTVSARSFLPLAPPVAILLVRRLGRQPTAGQPAYVWPLSASAALSLVIAWADFQLANSNRMAAEKLAARYGQGQLPWFEGHCGFQYYFQKAGARPVDYATSVLPTGDRMIVPSNNSNLRMPDAADAEVEATVEFPACDWLSTVHAQTGAGFYGAGGVVPYVFGPVPVEKYFVLKILRPLCFAPPELMNNRAWSLATAADPASRDGALAVQLAQRACDLTPGPKTIFLGTLGAAYAEAGRFDEAIATAQQACSNAVALGETNLLVRNQQLLSLYQHHQAHHEH